MRVSRLHVDGTLVPGTRIELGGERAGYLGRVLRARPGDRLVLFDGQGGELEATVTAVARERVAVAVGLRREVDRESPLAVTLGIGISRGERMDYALQKSTELGVAAVVPLLTERCVVQLDRERAASRLAHWTKVLIGACEQCGRSRLPALAPVTGLSDWLAGRVSGLRLVLSPEADTNLADLTPPEGELTLLIGPEGGLEPAEIALAARAGFRALRLGPRILRSETAVVAALAAIQARWGDLGGGARR